MTKNNDDEKEIISSDNAKLIKYSSYIIKRGLDLANYITSDKTKEFVNKIQELTTKEDIQIKAKTWKCIHILTGQKRSDNSSISISDDCLILATIHQCGKAEIWNILKRQLIYSLDCSYDFDQYNKRGYWLSYYISILIDNQTFVTINSNEIKKWNIATRELEYIIPARVRNINQDKQIIVIEDHGCIKVINLFKGNVLHTLHLEEFYTLEDIVISRNGIFIAASGSKYLDCHQDENGEYFETENSIKVWNLYTGELLHTLNKEIDITCHKSIYSIQISPSGKYLVSVDNYLSTDGLDEIDKYKVWNLHTGELLYILPIEAKLRDCSIITSNGHLITVTNGDCIIKVWDIHTGKLLTILIGHSDSVCCLAINPNNQMLISGSADKTVKLWNLLTCELLETLSGHEYPVKSITLSPSGEIIASTDIKGTTMLWKTM